MKYRARWSGENLELLNDPGTIDELATKVAEQWYGEKQDYDFSLHKAKEVPVDSGLIEDFT